MCSILTTDVPIRTGDLWAPQRYVSGNSLLGPQRGSQSLSSFAAKWRERLRMLWIIEEGHRVTTASFNVVWRVKVVNEYIICKLIIFWWWGELKKNLKNSISCYFNSTYAKSPHQVLRLFTMSCREWVWTHLWSIQNFPDAKKKTKFSMDRKKNNVHFALSKRPCLFMKAEASHNALGYSCSKWPLLSPYVCATLVLWSHIYMLWIVVVVVVVRATAILQQ